MFPFLLLLLRTFSRAHIASSGPLQGLSWDKDWFKHCRPLPGLIQGQECSLGRDQKCDRRKKEEEEDKTIFPFLAIHKIAQSHCYHEHKSGHGLAIRPEDTLFMSNFQSVIQEITIKLSEFQ